MHLTKLAEEECEHHDTGQDRKLGRLKVDRPEMQPTPGAVNLRADKLRQNQEDQAGEVHRERTPFYPAIVDQAHDHEGTEADHDPVGLLAPKLLRGRVLSHVGRAVDRDHAEDGEREHVHHENPILAEQFS